MMKYVLLFAFILLLQQATGQEKFQLAPPFLKYESGFFSGKTSFEITFDQPGSEVRYTLNGNEPGENDLLYTKPVAITKNTKVKARVFGKDFLPSETVNAVFVKDGKPILKAIFSKPHESYAGSKPNMLVDNIGGILNYRSGTWIGFDSDTVTVEIALQKKEKVQNVLISLLQDENSWIFLPEQIRVYYFDEKQNKYLPAGNEMFLHDEPGQKQCYLSEIKPAKSISADKLRLVMLPLKKIPVWHPGKGRHGWLFIDEIKVY